MWVPQVQELCFSHDVSPAPSPAPDTLRPLDRGLLNVSMTESELNRTRQLSLSSEKWHKSHSLLELEMPSSPCLSQLSAVSENHSFLLSLIYWGPLFQLLWRQTLAPSNIAFHSLVEGITHLSTEDKVLLSKTSISRKTLKHEAADEPFQWTFWYFEDGENSHMSLTL